MYRPDRSARVGAHQYSVFVSSGDPPRPAGRLLTQLNPPGSLPAWLLYTLDFEVSNGHPAGLNGGMSQDALLGLLSPLWHLAIGGCVLVTVVLCTRRLLRRGPSRMTRAMIVTGSAAVGLAVLGLVLAIR